MKCELCTYEWLPRVETPKACPRCKRRFDYPAKFLNQNPEGDEQ